MVCLSTWPTPAALGLGQGTPLTSIRMCLQAALRREAVQGLPGSPGHWCEGKAFLFSGLASCLDISKGPLDLAC